MRLNQLPKIVRDRLNQLAQDMPPEIASVLRAEAKAMSAVVDEFIAAALRGAQQLLARPYRCNELEQFTRRFKSIHDFVVWILLTITLL